MSLFDNMPAPCLAFLSPAVLISLLVGCGIGIWVQAWRAARKAGTSSSAGPDCRSLLRRLRPAWFLAGVPAGFLLACLAGYAVSQQQYFRKFHRFYDLIEPTTHFYPTASQVRNTVRRLAPRDKILVLVGGSSNFQGVGQSQKDLWTARLQEALGPEYAVVNLAVKGGRFADLGSVVVRMLAREYPRWIYIADVSATGIGGPNPPTAYQYFLWDAYYKGLLDGDGDSLSLVRQLANVQARAPGTAEMHLAAWIDSVTYARDLWGYVSYQFFSTVWADKLGDDIFRPRRWIPDLVYDLPPVEQRMTAKGPKYEEDLRQLTASWFSQEPGGRWAPNPDLVRVIRKELEGAWPRAERSRCLVALIWPNPWVLARLTPTERERNAEGYALIAQLWESAGYPVVQIGREFDPDDYVDRLHFTPAGGRKVAAIIAEEVRRLAQQNGYLAPPPAQ